MCIASGDRKLDPGKSERGRGGEGKGRHVEGLGDWQRNKRTDKQTGRRGRVSL